MPVWAAAYLNCSCSVAPLWRRYINRNAQERLEATTKKKQIESVIFPGGWNKLVDLVFFVVLVFAFKYVVFIKKTFRNFSIADMVGKICHFCKKRPLEEWNRIDSFLIFMHGVMIKYSQCSLCQSVCSIETSCLRNKLPQVRAKLKPIWTSPDPCGWHWSDLELTYESWCGRKSSGGHPRAPHL